MSNQGWKVWETTKWYILASVGVLAIVLSDLDPAYWVTKLPAITLAMLGLSTCLLALAGATRELEKR